MKVSNYLSGAVRQFSYWFVHGTLGYPVLEGIDCVHLYWCNECFIFDKQRNHLVSSDTYGEVVFESDFDIEYLPHLIVDLIMQLAKTENLNLQKYQLANITIEYVI